MAARGIVIHRFEFNDEELRAIAHAMGGKGRAARDTVRLWLTSLVQSTMDDVVDQYNLDKEQS